MTICPWHGGICASSVSVALWPRFLFSTEYWRCNAQQSALRTPCAFAQALKTVLVRVKVTSKVFAPLFRVKGGASLSGSKQQAASLCGTGESQEAVQVVPIRDLTHTILALEPIRVTGQQSGGSGHEQPLLAGVCPRKPPEMACFVTTGTLGALGTPTQVHLRSVGNRHNANRATLGGQQQVGIRSSTRCLTGDGGAAAAGRTRGVGVAFTPISADAGPPPKKAQGREGMTL